MILNKSKYLIILEYFRILTICFLFLGDIIRAVTELDRVHVICILDICNLGNNKVEVYLHKIYRPDNAP